MFKRFKIIKVIAAASEKGNIINDKDITFNYTVSAGKNVGQGAKVVWDLSGVAPGNYTIIAGVDDGCGICGTTKT